jgi:hypothetical protein
MSSGKTTDKQGNPELLPVAGVAVGADEACAAVGLADAAADGIAVGVLVSGVPLTTFTALTAGWPK